TTRCICWMRRHYTPTDHSRIPRPFPEAYIQLIPQLSSPVQFVADPRYMKNRVKNFLKDRLLIFKVAERFSPSVQIGQRQLYHHYRALLRNGDLPEVSETGFRVFSQLEEDGKLLFIFSILGMSNKTFVEIGSDDGINSNSANLYFNF